MMEKQRKKKRSKRGSLRYGILLIGLILACLALLIYGICTVFVAVQANGFDRTVRPISIRQEEGRTVLQVLDFQWDIPWSLPDESGEGETEASE